MDNHYEIIKNEDWRTGGCWALIKNGQRVMVNDDKNVLLVYVGLLELEEKN